jgi:ATP-dependent Lhr-like helicase
MPLDPLHLFLPPVREWFRTQLGEPTTAQKEGWPAIAAGQNTLILAPTGSGKTLAAFLACLDGLWRLNSVPEGVRVLYVSPLKALNNDIYRNLQVPLEGVSETARNMGQPLPAIRAAVRTGDTTPVQRQQILRKPPQVLITTPESLHLMLTSRARDILRGITHCIVDEIHAVCANKRGVFLALLLERLQANARHPFARIGLSATQRPLEEVAAFLGGSAQAADGTFRQRPVTVIDAGLRKDLDLRVINPVERFGALPEKSVWPSIYRLVEQEIRQHRSTIVFVNNRRAVERITANLNAALAENDAPLARAHHGSIALDVRRQTETALKEGRLPAVVATSSLELGIDMGAVDLVCQVESPGSVTRGLQRVGRAGHLVGKQSKGRLIPKTPADLLEQAVVVREMAAGNVEHIRVPVNCLDVLAQQIVAMAAMDDWDAGALYATVRRAYPYRQLSPAAFESVLEMVSGRYRWQGGDRVASAVASLKPRVSWDRVHNRVLGMPGSRQLALVSGGTIPDTGQYAAYTTGGLRLGELDEEFVFERRVGDTFLLGTSSWRLERVEADRVILSPAAGAPALVPFWHGEHTGRTRDLGVAIGRFLRELSERIDAADCGDWLQREFFLDAAAARNLIAYVRRHLKSTDSVPTDRRLVVEASRDPIGDWQVILLSPLGSRLHLALRLALEARLRQRLGYSPQCLHHDDGILIRLPDSDVPVMDLFEGLTPENVEQLILSELADSALFALRFRQNAARALLLPRVHPGKRAPLWLQRLRGRDLLGIARRYRDFPIVAETFRECLEDHLDVPSLKELLSDIRDGKIEIVTRRAETPSPFASQLLFAYVGEFMYQHDGVAGDPSTLPSGVDLELLEQLTKPSEAEHLLDPRAIRQVELRLRGGARPPRSVTEMAEWLRRLGDIGASEIEGPMGGFLGELERDGRAKRIELARCREPVRWILVEEIQAYEAAFGLGAAASKGHAGPSAEEAAQTILRRFLETHALVSLKDVLERYPFEPSWARRQLQSWSRSGEIVAASPAEDPEAEKWAAPANLQQVRRGTLALLRREVVPCTAPQFADFLLRWQFLHPATRRQGEEGLRAVLERLHALALPAESWEQFVLPGRVTDYQPALLDQWLGSGEGLWAGDTHSEGSGDLVAFIRRDELAEFPAPQPDDRPALDPETERVLQLLRERGAAFVSDLAGALSMPPRQVRGALWRLLRRRLVTNDSLNVIRQGEVDEADYPAREETALSRPTTRLFARSARRVRRPGPARTEGRWSAIAWGQPEPESRVIFQANLLLQRYGVASRELARLDPWMPPWRVLYEVLSRIEMAGFVRRGYFVEGLSGAQFALPEAAQLLQESNVPSTATAPVVLVHSLDPANLYGSGAPLDIPLLDGGTRPLLRRAGNWLALRAGRPVLIVEQSGKRITALASASAEDQARAVACLPEIQRLSGRRDMPHKLTVDEWNGEAVTRTAGRELLQAAGFVTDYQSMTLYSTWK